jgi:beta-glucosidase
MTDAPDLSLPDGQDGLIASVAAVNPNTVVVLETGGPVRMPWLAQTAAVVAAWYPGARGGEAVARILFGEVEPSGRLPVTFPVREAQLPRPDIDTRTDGPAPAVDYSEGALAGYRWFAAQALTPLFPFGFGLSYSAFGYGGLTVTAVDASLTVSLDVTNTGRRRGAAVPQIYLRRPGDPDFPLRLAGFTKIWLDPGETRRVTMTVDPRLLGRFDAAAGDVEIAPGRYAVAAGADAANLPLTAEFSLSGGPAGRPVAR